MQMPLFPRAPGPSLLLMTFLPILLALPLSTTLLTLTLDSQCHDADDLVSSFARHLESIGHFSAFFTSISSALTLLIHLWIFDIFGGVRVKVQMTFSSCGTHLGGFDENMGLIYIDLDLFDRFGALPRRLPFRH